jgi:hypothetical protein
MKINQAPQPRNATSTKAKVECIGSTSTQSNFVMHVRDIVQRIHKSPIVMSCFVFLLLPNDVHLHGNATSRDIDFSDISDSLT